MKVILQYSFTYVPAAVSRIARATTISMANYTDYRLVPCSFRCHFMICPWPQSVLADYLGHIYT